MREVSDVMPRSGAALWSTAHVRMQAVSALTPKPPLVQSQARYKMRGILQSDMLWREELAHREEAFFRRNNQIAVSKPAQPSVDNAKEEPIEYVAADPRPRTAAAIRVRMHRERQAAQAALDARLEANAEAALEISTAGPRASLERSERASAITDEFMEKYARAREASNHAAAIAHSTPLPASPAAASASARSASSASLAGASTPRRLGASSSSSLCVSGGSGGGGSGGACSTRPTGMRSGSTRSVASVASARDPAVEAALREAAAASRARISRSQSRLAANQLTADVHTGRSPQPTVPQHQEQQRRASAVREARSVYAQMQRGGSGLVRAGSAQVVKAPGGGVQAASGVMGGAAAAAAGAIDAVHHVHTRTDESATASGGVDAAAHADGEGGEGGHGGVNGEGSRGGEGGESVKSSDSGKSVRGDPLREVLASVTSIAESIQLMYDTAAPVMTELTPSKPSCADSAAATCDSGGGRSGKSSGVRSIASPPAPPEWTRPSVSLKSSSPGSSTDAVVAAPTPSAAPTLLHRAATASALAPGEAPQPHVSHATHAGGMLHYASAKVIDMAVHSYAPRHGQRRRGQPPAAADVCALRAAPPLTAFRCDGVDEPIEPTPAVSEAGEDEGHGTSEDTPDDAPDVSDVPLCVAPTAAALAPVPAALSFDASDAREAPRPLVVDGAREWRPSREDALTAAELPLRKRREHQRQQAALRKQELATLHSFIHSRHEFADAAALNAADAATLTAADANATDDPINAAATFTDADANVTDAAIKAAAALATSFAPASTGSTGAAGRERSADAPAVAVPPAVSHKRATQLRHATTVQLRALIRVETGAVREYIADIIASR